MSQAVRQERSMAFPSQPRQRRRSESCVHIVAQRLCNRWCCEWCCSGWRGRQPGSKCGRARSGSIHDRPAMFSAIPVIQPAPSLTPNQPILIPSVVTITIHASASPKAPTASRPRAGAAVDATTQQYSPSRSIYLPNTTHSEPSNHVFP